MPRWVQDAMAGDRQEAYMASKVAPLPALLREQVVH